MDYKTQIREKHIWVIRLRYVLSAVFAGGYILRVPIDQILNQGFPMLLLAAVIMVIVASNYIWMRLLKGGKVEPDTIAYFQCIFDLLVVSLLVHQHGASGLMGYLYVLVIFVAGVLLPRKGILLIAACASVLYMLLLLMQTYGLTVPLPPMLAGGEGLLPPNIQFLIDVCIKVFFFYLIAFSCANMQDMLAKTTKESEFMASFNQGIIDMVPIGVMVVDIGRNILVFNPAMERTSMVPAATAMGMRLDEVFKGIDDTWEQALCKVEEAGEEVRLLGAVMPIAGGKEVRANVRFQPLKVNDQVLGSVCIVQTAAR